VGIDYCAKFGNKSDCQIVGFGLVFGHVKVFGLWSLEMSTDSVTGTKDQRPTNDIRLSIRIFASFVID
jgi:hypothetical protein